MVLGDEDQDVFDALEAALMAELAPEDALQAVLARRIVFATWRLERVERMEAEMFAQNMADTASFGLGMIRDCNRGRAFDTLLRYRGTTLAEFWRSLRTLKELQTEAAAHAAQDAAQHAQGAQPNEPEIRTSAGASGAKADPSVPSPAPGPVGCDAARKGLGPVGGQVGARLAPSPAVGFQAREASGPDPATPSPEAATAPGTAADAAPAARTGDLVAASSEVPSGPKARTNPGESSVVMDRIQPLIGQPSRPACRAVAGINSHGPMDLPNTTLGDHG